MAPAAASSFPLLLGAVAPVFIMLAIGWAMRRAGALTAEADAAILRLGVNVFYPALIADTILGNEALRHIGNLLLPAVLGSATTLLGFGVAMLAAYFLRLPRPRTARTFGFSVGLQNYGFIAIPLVDMLFGRATLGVQFTFTLGVELALWSVGVWLLSGCADSSPSQSPFPSPSVPSFSSSSSSSSPEDEPKEKKREMTREIPPTRPTTLPVWRAMLTAPVIAIIVSTAINYAWGADWLPQFGRAAIKSLGACSIPTQIVLTGAVLADVIRRANPGASFKPIVFGSIVRLGVLPVLILGLLSRLGTSTELHHVLVVQAAMPSAMIPVILVKYYDGDTDIAGWLVSVTTALGVVTIPLWMHIGIWWVGG